MSTCGACGTIAPPPMSGGGKKKTKQPRKKLVKKGGSISEANVDELFKDVPGGRQRNSPRRNLLDTTFGDIDKFDFLNFVTEYNEKEPKSFDWTILITSMDNEQFGYGISANGVTISTPQENSTLDNWSLANIETIVVNEKTVYSLEFVEDAYLKVPFNILVMMKAIKIAIDKQFCKVDECTVSGIPLNKIFATFLASDEMTNHLTKLQQSINAKAADIKKQPVVSTADIDDLANLLSGLGSSSKPMNNNAVTKKNIISTIVEKIDQVVGNGNIFNYGTTIEKITHMIMDANNASILDDASKSALLSYLHEEIVTAAQNYMVYKTSKKRYRNIILLEHANLIMRKDGTDEEFRKLKNKAEKVIYAYGNLFQQSGGKKKKTLKKKVQKRK
jgi:hypothetical protein